jgi:hypothetical protein
MDGQAGSMAITIEGGMTAADLDNARAQLLTVMKSAGENGVAFPSDTTS